MGFFTKVLKCFLCVNLFLLITYIKFLASSNHLRHLAKENQDFQNLKLNLTNFCNKLTIYYTIITLRHSQARINIYNILQYTVIFSVENYPIILLPHSQFGQTLSTEDWSYQTR